MAMSSARMILSWDPSGARLNRRVIRDEPEICETRPEPLGVSQTYVVYAYSARGLARRRSGNLRQWVTLTGLVTIRVWAMKTDRRKG